MKRIITATAISLMLTTSLYAANEVKPLQTYEFNESANMSDVLASDLIGMRIYSVEENYDRFNEDYQAQADEEKDWDDIGEVNDVILGFDGSVKAVILGVGGFLGIGEKDIALPMEQLKVVREQDDADSYFLVVNANKDVLTNAAAYENPYADEAETAATQTSEGMEKPADTAMTTETDTSTETAMSQDSDAGVTAAPETAMTPQTDADGRALLPRAEVERDGYTEAVVAELTADDLEGATIYDANDEDIGEIDSLIVSQDGTIEKVILDVGGFLGIGEREVAVTFDELQIIRNEDGSDLRVYVGATKEELEAQPDYVAE
ncbi:PRC-barrel domain-containing protein [Roseibium aggregatum]|uniref:PRC-barrel domain-containing protein n=2 Tax=Roseibium aggregatum TaxID=187304 RepID=UPI0025ACD15E|nr:PRC-barrel domain-containing protein [Roseibium aggregatum]WJS04659.1 PRC-barrel domain-containing protein [Roseibium aggregatum]